MSSIALPAGRQIPIQVDFDKLPVFDNQGAAGHTHRAEAVADEHAVLSFNQFGETLKDFVLGADIEGGGRRRTCVPGFGQRFLLARCHLFLVSLGQSEMQPRRYTAEEYFALEEKGEIRHEFFEGEVFAMVGESIAHNIIAQKFVLALRPALRGKNYQVIYGNRAVSC